MSNFQTVLDGIQETPPTRAQQEQYFEDRIQKFLLESPGYREFFLDVRKYADWSKDQDIHTRGPAFDLVGTDRSGQLWGIECKWCEPAAAISKRAVDSFRRQVKSFCRLAQSEPFGGFVLVHPGRTGKSLEEVRQSCSKPVQVVDFEALSRSAYDWPIPALELGGLWRCYRQGDGWLEVLRGAALSIMPGEAVALVGPSGSGKSTLLQTAGLLDTPDAGQVRIAGFDAGAAGDAMRTALRRIHIGFVYQFHHLLPELSAVENVSAPLRIAGRGPAAAEERARSLLARFGLAKRAGHRPGELSGGEQQRVAICRAVAARPSLLLADEPTGNLDPDTAGGVLGALLELVRRENLALLAATHNPEMAARMDRVVAIRQGCLEQVR